MVWCVCMYVYSEIPPGQTHLRSYASRLLIYPVKSPLCHMPASGQTPSPVSERDVVRRDVDMTCHCTDINDWTKAYDIMRLKL